MGRLERAESGVTVEALAAIFAALGVSLGEFFKPFKEVVRPRTPSHFSGHSRRSVATPPRAMQQRVALSGLPVCVKRQAPSVPVAFGAFGCLGEVSRTFPYRCTSRQGFFALGR